MTAVQSRARPATARPMRPVENPAVWLGSDMAKTDEWIHTLSAEDIGELDAALRQTQQRGLAIIDIGRQDFPLPTLGPVLDDLQDQVINGRGFVLIKRIPVERYTDAEAQTIYWGMGTYWGDAVSQNGKGHVLGHVKDLGMAEGDPARRGYQTTLKLRYHTDSCDIVGLMCLAKAKSGGLSSIASAGAIHNEILRRRPDLVEVLRGPFYMDCKCEVPDGKLPYAAAPVFNYDDVHFRGRGLRHPVRDKRVEEPERTADRPEPDGRGAVRDPWARRKRDSGTAIFRLVFRSRHFVPLGPRQTAAFMPTRWNQMSESQH